MTKPQYSQLVAKLEYLTPLWQERMGLAHFTIEQIFLDEYFGDDGEEDFKVTATTQSRWQYLQAKIKWHLPVAVSKDEDALERTVVHELCHVLLAPEQVLIDARLGALCDGLTEAEAWDLSDRYYEHLELSTEMAAKAIMSVWGCKTSVLMDDGRLNCGFGLG